MKYLLEIHHGIGDIVQYTGLIRSVKAHDEHAYIGMVINKDYYKTLLSYDNNINEIFVIDFSGKKKRLIENVKKIRKRQFDYMICSIHSSQKSMELMAVLFGAKKVVGTKLSRLAKISAKYKNVTVNCADHVVKQNYDVLCGLDDLFTMYEPYLVCPEAPIKLEKKSIGICIGTSIPQKNWPIDRYIALGESMEQLGYTIVLLGGKQEKVRFDQCGYNNDNWINLLGKTDLIGSASECVQCELIIGGDTGLMHIAAAVGVKTLTLFSCSEPTTHAPFSKESYFYFVPTECQFCFGTEKMRSCQNYKCVTRIETDKIIDLAKTILSGSNVADQYKLNIEKMKEIE